ALAQAIRAGPGRIVGVRHCAHPASAPTLAARAALARATRADALDCFVACEARDADPEREPAAALVARFVERRDARVQA
ncbi:hypothetical protein AAHH79_40300, partial [Burkholderia pseudomallei]